MNRCLVTGAAGFVGSHLCEALLARGHEVVGVDAFIPYYPRAVKEQNLAGLLTHPHFTFHDTDLRVAELVPIVTKCDTVFHLAAMPGLMKSWTDFQLYETCNISGTQRLLEAARVVKIKQFIHISTSSVYGREATQGEDAPLQPVSPYGVTKLAAENLCRAYEANFNLPITILRYFSVYGPRQRPDMGYHKLINNLLRGGTFTVFGDGEQTRSNTYVGDAVAATILAFEKRAVTLGQVFNIGGGEIVSLNRVIAMLEEITGRKAPLEREPARPGDQRHTAANVEKARRVLGFNPTTRLAEGLRAQVEWQRAQA
ncbi:MAG: NAD-dependent epimerase/dehydratase family protein [Verrucomicrobia bacterium]|nr:MAG: NAD-dependent epimerase/dehydratase family protein [Verrucomicrobiota bacterium]